MNYKDSMQILMCRTSGWLVHKLNTLLVLYYGIHEIKFIFDVIVIALSFNLVKPDTMYMEYDHILST